MKSIDYIIVGDGYAGLFFAHLLIKNKKNFVLFSENEKGASQVSAGIINPVVLKKFTTFWKAKEQINHLHETLLEIQEYTGKNYLVNEPIHRVFHDENEKSLWLKKTQKEDLIPFLNPDFSIIESINNPFGTGKVNDSARFNVHQFFTDFFLYLKQHSHLIQQKFDYDALNPKERTYKDYSFNKIVFCEGTNVLNNPYFNKIDIQPNKGHHLKVKLSEFIPDKVIIKKKHFLFPVDNGSYYYGGTYDRENRSSEIDEIAVSQLVNGLEEIYSHPYEIEAINYGFRPTVKDRRPILGNHPEFNNLFVFNGLGARGILNGCYFSKTLFDFIEEGILLPTEVDLQRFNKSF